MSAFLTTAKDKNGADVKIEDAISGKKCGCVCPICGNPLIARNSIPIELAKHAHHFAHQKGCLCEATDETVLHQYAKDILVEEKALMLPISDDNRPSGLVHFRSVEQEKWDSELGIRPDIDAILDNGERLLIEFYVSHKVTAKKRGVIVKNKLNCIEIDFNYVNFDKEAIRSFLLEDPDNKNWISAPEKRGKSDGRFSFRSRNLWQEKAIEFLKIRLKECNVDIRRYYETHNLQESGYDVFESKRMYRGFRSDFIMYRSKYDNKGYIAISVRGRRRNEKHKHPRGLRVIDIIIRREEDYNKLVERGNLCYEKGFIIYEGFEFREKPVYGSLYEPDL